MKFQRILTSPDELKVFADPIRLLLFRLLIAHEATLTQLSRALGLKPNLVHYHLKKLLALQLIQMTRHDDDGKHYRATYLNVGIAPGLRLNDTADTAALPPEQPSTFTPSDHDQALHATLNLSDDDARALRAECNALLAKYRAKQHPQATARTLTIALVNIPEKKKETP